MHMPQSRMFPPNVAIHPLYPCASGEIALPWSWEWLGYSCEGIYIAMYKVILLYIAY